MSFRIITPQEAAEYIHHDDNIGFSGFTPSGAPKVIARAIAAKAEAEHAAGREYKIGVFTGASTGDDLEGVLARANAVKYRVPYQSNKDLRNRINAGDANYTDVHLSNLAQDLRCGFYGKIKLAVIEAADITDNGEVLLTTGVGITPTLARLADHFIIELNAAHPKFIKGLHDIYVCADPPYRREIPIYKASDHIGEPILKLDPAKIIGIVETNQREHVAGFSEPDAVTQAIGDNVARFLVSELKAGRIPASFLPIQSGVGNIANALLGSLGQNPDVPAFEMYTEVIQDAVIGLMQEGKVKYASGCSLSITNDVLNNIYDNWDFFKDKLVLRSSEISNSPEIARRLGLIAINTALEADIYGNINSTHVMGSKMMNGIGGSGDFTRNAYLSIFTCPSVAKGGKISAIVPMVSHLDHSEHSVRVLVTEQGVADLRAKTPVQRAQCIIENCVHPDYKQLLWDYTKLCKTAHTPHDLSRVFKMHLELADSGDMHNTRW